MRENKIETKSIIFNSDRNMLSQKPKKSRIDSQVETTSKNNQRGMELVLASRKQSSD